MTKGSQGHAGGSKGGDGVAGFEGMRRRAEGLKECGDA